MQTYHDYAAAASTYVAACLALFVEHSSTVVQVLGFILLVARLIQELPRAATVIYRTFNRVETKTELGTTIVTTEKTVKKSG